MKGLVILLAAVACHAAPQMLPYSVVPGASTIIHTDSLSPPVMKIPKPGIRFNVPSPVTYTAPAVPVQVAPIQTPVVQAAPVAYSAPVAPAVVAAAPVPSVAVAAAPVQAVVAAAPAVPSAITYAQAPEPLQAPDPPMPSVGTPHVGGQFHAQDEAGQYSFGHWGGPNTRVETRDSLGRTAGSFAYVDPVGEVQVRKYAAAPASGFKVAASDLP